MLDRRRVVLYKIHHNPRNQLSVIGACPSRVDLFFDWDDLAGPLLLQLKVFVVDKLAAAG